MKLIYSLILLLCCLPYIAFALQSGDFEYEIDEQDMAIITAYTGNATELEIPRVIEKYQVSSFQFKYDFEYRSQKHLITSITIPDSITAINATTIFGLRNLVSIKVSADNPNFTSVDGVIFNKNLTKIIAFPPGKGGKYVIPSSVTEIGTSAFSNSSLSSVELSNSVTKIETAAFTNSSITSIELPSSVTEIGGLAFGMCFELASVKLSNATQKIGAAAFYFCKKLEIIDIPSSITEIGSSAFLRCDLAAINVSSDNPNYLSINGVLFNKDQTTLILFPNAQGGEYTIPDTVTKIEDRAFDSCVKLTSVTIPDTVTHIGDSAFYDCTSLTSITLSNSLLHIGDGAFSGCEGLTSIDIPASVTYLGRAFEYCDLLEEINVDKENPVYSSEDGIVFNKDKSEIIFFSWQNADEYIIPSSVKVIGKYAFAERDNLQKIILPKGLKEIGDNAFDGCSKLKEVIIPDGVTIIGDSAFESCTGLTAVTIPNSVTTIGNCAFYWCDSLDELIVPDSVTSLGADVFSLK